MSNQKKPENRCIGDIHNNNLIPKKQSLAELCRDLVSEDDVSEMKINESYSSQELQWIRETLINTIGSFQPLEVPKIQKEILKEIQKQKNVMLDILLKDGDVIQNIHSFMYCIGVLSVMNILEDNTTNDNKNVEVIVICPTIEKARNIRIAVMNSGKCFKKLLKALIPEGVIDVDLTIRVFNRAFHVAASTPEKLISYFENDMIPIKHIKLVVLAEFGDTLCTVNSHMCRPIRVILRGYLQSKNIDIIKITTVLENKETKELAKKPNILDTLKKNRKNKLDRKLEYVLHHCISEDKPGIVIDIMKVFRDSKIICYCNTTQQVDSLFECMDKQEYINNVRILSVQKRQMNKEWFKSNSNGCMLISKDSVEIQCDIVIIVDIPFVSEVFLSRCSGDIVICLWDARHEQGMQAICMSDIKDMEPEFNSLNSCIMDKKEEVKRKRDYQDRMDREVNERSGYRGYRTNSRTRSRTKTRSRSRSRSRKNRRSKRRS